MEEEVIYAMSRSVWAKIFTNRSLCNVAALAHACEFSVMNEVRRLKSAVATKLWSRFNE